LHDLLLAVDGDRATGEIGERDAPRFAAEAKHDAMVHHPLAPHALPDAAALEHLRRALLEQPRAHALLDVAARLVLDDDRFDAGAVQQMREEKARRPRADDPDLRAHRPAALLGVVEALELAHDLLAPLEQVVELRVAARDRGGIRADLRVEAALFLLEKTAAIDALRCGHRAILPSGPEMRVER